MLFLREGRREEKKGGRSLGVETERGKRERGEEREGGEETTYLVVEKGGADCRDEELAAVCVGAGVLRSVLEFWEMYGLQLIFRD